MTLAAFLDMAAERCRAADLDGSQDAQLAPRQRVRAAISGAVLPEDTGQLESRPRHLFFFRSAGRLVGRFSSRSERSERGTDDLRSHRRVVGSGIDQAMAEQYLNDPNVGSVFEQMGRRNCVRGVSAVTFLRSPLRDRASRQAYWRAPAPRWRPVRQVREQGWPSGPPARQ